jgi:protein KRI1
VEEQQVLRNETIAAFHGAVAGEDEDGDENDDGGGLLVPREKTKDEMEQEEEEYRAYLKKEVGSDLEDLITVEKVDNGFEKSSDIEVDAKKKKKKKKSKESKAKSKEQEDHEFLMRYPFFRQVIAGIKLFLAISSTVAG